MKIKNTTYKDGYNPLTDKVMGVITIHLEHETLFAISVDFEITNAGGAISNLLDVRSQFIPKTIQDLGKDEF